MFKTITVSLLALIAIVSQASVVSATSPLESEIQSIDAFSVVNLQKGETLEISYKSMGCFHEDVGGLKLTFDSVEYKGETRPLTTKQAAGLDRYFQKLARKQGSPGRCTTVTTIGLILARDTELLAQRFLVDDFCSGLLDGTDEILSPGHLRYDLFEKLEDIQMTPFPKK